MGIFVTCGNADLLLVGEFFIGDFDLLRVEPGLGSFVGELVRGPWVSFAFLSRLDQLECERKGEKNM